VPPPRVAVGPEPVPPWAIAAVEAGGASIVDVSDADALVWMNPRGVSALDDELARAGPDLRWVQLPFAGVEVFDPERFRDGRTWTCGKGVYAEPCAEHVMALALTGLRRIHEFAAATTWGRPAGRSLFDGRVTILGAGGIAETLLTLLAPYRVETTVIRRDHEPEALDEALTTADVVVLALALTPETRGIISARELALMQSHAWLINVARGAHVVTNDLVAALRDGVIGGAGLDVTDPEPLPDGHPLWTLPNCIITPHTANTPEMAVAPLTARITENVRRFAVGQPLIGLVDPALGY
jgi:phosphoglycerate dehydrogenase-like enzyme